MKHTPGKVIKLLNPVRESREQLLERLYLEYGSEVVNFIRQRASQSDEDPEDVAQEVFAKLATRKQLLEDFRQGHVNKRPYLFSMANNLLVDLERRRKLKHKYQQRESEQRIVEESLQGETLEDLAVINSNMRHFKKAIAGLKPTWRRAFLLNRFKYMTHKEIARHMGVTAKQVENYLTQAVIRLREVQARLEESGE